MIPSAEFYWGYAIGILTCIKNLLFYLMIFFLVSIKLKVLFEPDHLMFGTQTVLILLAFQLDR